MPALLLFPIFYLLAGYLASAGHQPGSLHLAWSWLDAAFGAAAAESAAGSPGPRTAISLGLPIIGSVLAGIVAIGMFSNGERPLTRPMNRLPWNAPSTMTVRLRDVIRVAGILVAHWVREEFGLDRLPPEVSKWPWYAKLVVVGVVASMTLSVCLLIHIACLMLAHAIK